jgi:hypothetical protein
MPTFNATVSFIVRVQADYAWIDLHEQSARDTIEAAAKEGYPLKAGHRYTTMVSDL